MKPLNDYLQPDGLYDDNAIVLDTIAEYGVDRSIARDTERTPVRDLLLAARIHNVEVLGRRKQADENTARSILAQDAFSRDDWRWLTDHGYARFCADEASADGAFWRTSYQLTSKAEELL